MVTALVVMIAVSRNPSLPEDYEPGEAPNTTLAYRQAELSLDFSDRWGDTESGEVTPVEEFVTGSLTKTVRTISFARPPVQEASRPQPSGFVLASADARQIDIGEPRLPARRSRSSSRTRSHNICGRSTAPAGQEGRHRRFHLEGSCRRQAHWHVASEYVIRGMDSDFREQLYHAGRAMDAAGMRWSMLSAFRDDYRQALAAGFKARPGNSLHGGSRAVGGYGNGRAIDINGTDGGDEQVWRWIDAHGARYGLRRPMPGYDPAHIQAGGDWRKLAGVAAPGADQGSQDKGPGCDGGAEGRRRQDPGRRNRIGEVTRLPLF